MKKNKAIILIDDSNIYYGLKKLRWKLDYAKFYKWLINNFDSIGIYFFGGIIAKKAFFDSNPSKNIRDFKLTKDKREKFFKVLKNIGYLVKTKPVESIYDRTSGNYKKKCNFDVEITLLALDKINDYKEIVLCSGDGDFVKLIKYLKGKYKKTTIIAQKDRINETLEMTANRVIYLNNLKSDVEYKKGLP